jgi:pre-mRNA-splicing factor ATP-dependent RNA helicase DHX38/PRP16
VLTLESVESESLLQILANDCMESLESEVAGVVSRYLRQPPNLSLAARLVDAGKASITFEHKRGNSNSQAIGKFQDDCHRCGIESDKVSGEIFNLISRHYQDDSTRSTSSSSHERSHCMLPPASTPNSAWVSEERDDRSTKFDSGFQEQGGLVVFKKPAVPTQRTSVLGLDRLAAEKRGEEDAKERDPEFRNSSSFNPKKRLREPRMETPSHPGGVDWDAKRRIEDRRRRERGMDLDSTDSSHQRPHGSDRYQDDYVRGSRDREFHRGRNGDNRDGPQDYSYSRSSGPYDRDGDRQNGRPYDHRDDRYRDDRRDRPNWREEYGKSPMKPNPSSSSTPHSSRSSTSRYDSSSLGRVFDRTPIGTGRVGSMRGSETPNLSHMGLSSRDINSNAVDFDRDFYDQEEDMGSTVDESRDPFLSDAEDVRNFEAALERRQRGGYSTTSEGGSNTPTAQAAQRTRMSAKYSAVMQDRNRWEEDRLLASGIMQRTTFTLATDLEDETEIRVQLTVHDTKPPFLDGRISFTKVLDPVLPVKDPTSDVAVLSRKGSKILRETKDQKDRLASLKKFWELEGSKMGDLIGVAKKANQDADEDSGSYTTSISSSSAGDIRTEAEKKDDWSRIQYIRSRLPIATCKKELLNLIRENNIVIIIGETGSGKTTQMTQYLYEAGYAKKGMIGCTQPRRVAAMSVAKRVAEEMGSTIGGLVGYTIRFEDVTSPETKVRYLTDGVLVRESLMDRDLDQYSVIIMDEAHERALNTDVLFGILKQVARRRSDIKLIITSATMDADKFARFFGGVPTFRIPGRTFPVETLFTKTPVEDYVDAAVAQTLQIHVGKGPGDILIFMTGQEDVEMTCLLIQEGLSKLGENVKPLMVLPMYSQLPADMQSKIFDKAAPGVRKVIVSTNVAETSLTVDGIYYVIDSGFIKLKVYNPKIGMDALQVFPVSKASADQRAGRAGRTGPGVCYRLFTERIYRDELLLTTVPEIQRTHLANIVLLLKTLGIGNLLDFDFMDPPPQDNIQQSLYQLWVLGALDDTGALTKMGRKMAEFPLDPPLSKMLIVSEDLGCSEEVATVVSMLSVPSVWVRPKERAEESDLAREKFMVPESDHLTLLFVFQQWIAMGRSNRWCAENFVQAKALRRVAEIREQLVDIMRKSGMRLRSCGGQWDPVREAICSAFFHNAAKMKGVGEYINMRTGLPCHLHPTSSLYGLGYTPEYIVYHELVYTTKEYMQHVTAVDPYWLARVGPMFYSVKETGLTRSERLAKEKNEKERMEREMEEKSRAEQLEAQQREEAEQLVRKAKEDEIVSFGAKTPKIRRRGVL